MLANIASNNAWIELMLVKIEAIRPTSRAFRAGIKPDKH